MSSTELALAQMQRTNLGLVAGFAVVALLLAVALAWVNRDVVAAMRLPRRRRPRVRYRPEHSLRIPREAVPAPSDINEAIGEAVTRLSDDLDRAIDEALALLDDTSAHQGGYTARHWGGDTAQDAVVYPLPRHAAPDDPRLYAALTTPTQAMPVLSEVAA